jgi:hypothetical protein
MEPSDWLQQGMLASYFLQQVEKNEKDGNNKF